MIDHFENIWKFIKGKWGIELINSNKIIPFEGAEDNINTSCIIKDKKDYLYVKDKEDFYALFHGLGHILMLHDDYSMDFNVTEEEKEMEAAIFAMHTCRNLCLVYPLVLHNSFIKKQLEKSKKFSTVPSLCNDTAIKASREFCRFYNEYLDNLKVSIK